LLKENLSPDGITRLRDLVRGLARRAESGKKKNA
jgi:hypothetical protein